MVKAPHTFSYQIRENALAIISLLVAVVTLCYVGWRHEQTEQNFNNRAASFEILKNLGELQRVVNYQRYQPDNTKADTLGGWGNVALISDLSQILPNPIPASAHDLVSVWKNNQATIQSSDESADAISNQIDKTRQEVVTLLRSLK